MMDISHRFGASYFCDYPEDDRDQDERNLNKKFGSLAYIGDLWRIKKQWIMTDLNTGSKICPHSVDGKMHSSLDLLKRLFLNLNTVTFVDCTSLFSDEGKTDICMGYVIRALNNGVSIIFAEDRFDIIRRAADAFYETERD